MFYGVENMVDRDDLLLQARGLLSGCRDPVANAANLSALIWQALPRINWAGFYFMRDGRLLLGPFQGKPACVEIRLDQGVCGLAARERRTVRVDDVHRFPGHIACDSASRSELVVPLVDDSDTLLGVLDIDSPETGRFGEPEQALFEGLARVWIQSLG